jgi:transposase-like protein
MKDVLLDNAAAFAFLEARRWSKGQICPHCNAEGRFRSVHRSADVMNAYKCYACRAFFTLRVGTRLEGSHLPFDTWLAATYLMVASKGTVTVLCLAETLGITFQTATKLRRMLVDFVDDAVPGPQQQLAKAVAMARRNETSATMCPCQGPERPTHSPRQERQRTLAALVEALWSPDVERAFEVAVNRLLQPEKRRCECRSNSSVQAGDTEIRAECLNNSQGPDGALAMQRSAAD